jgi:hypothetical protein
VFPNGEDAPLPGILPNTGGLADEAIVSGPWSVVTWADRLPLVGLLALLFTVGSAAGYGLGRHRELRARRPRPTEG